MQDEQKIEEAPIVAPEVAVEAPVEEAVEAPVEEIPAEPAVA